MGSTFTYTSAGLGEEIGSTSLIGSSTTCSTIISGYSSTGSSFTADISTFSGTSALGASTGFAASSTLLSPKRVCWSSSSLASFFCCSAILSISS
jgi:hypothetical protein